MSTSASCCMQQWNNGTLNNDDGTLNLSINTYSHYKLDLLLII